MLPMYHTGIIPLIYICNHGLWKGSLAPLGFWNLILVLHGSSSQWSDSWSMSGSWPKNLFTRCTCVHLCVGRKFIMQSAFLKHCCSRSLLLLFTSASLCQAITLFHTSKLFPMCTLKSSKTIVDLLVLTLRRASPFSSMNSAHSALKFVLYSCISGVGNLRHACHTWHAKQFLVARRSSMFYISILFWFKRSIIDLDLYKIQMWLAHWMMWNLNLARIYQKVATPAVYTCV